MNFPFSNKITPIILCLWLINAQQYVGLKQQIETKDIHEKDASHLLDSYNAACSLIDKYNWCEIKCVKDEKIRTIEEIHEDIYNEVKKYL